MSKNQRQPAQTNVLSKHAWYTFSIIVGVFIAFLMFNDIIMSILFGLPIGFMFALTLHDKVNNNPSK